MYNISFQNKRIFDFHTINTWVGDKCSRPFEFIVFTEEKESLSTTTIADICKDILSIPSEGKIDSNHIAVDSNIVQKALRIVQGIYNINSNLIADLDYSSTPYGTISIELEKEIESNEIYLHIEIGITKTNWQFRINGKKKDYEEGIEFKLDDYCNLMNSYPEVINRGIKLYIEN